MIAGGYAKSYDLFYRPGCNEAHSFVASSNECWERTDSLLPSFRVAGLVKSFVSPLQLSHGATIHCR